MTDFSTWYTKQHAADRIGVSTKTVEQYANTGKIQQGVFKRPTDGRSVAVYAPEDVDRLAGERAQKPFVVAATPPVASNGHGLAPLAPAADGAAILQAVLRTIQKASEHSEKLFLTIPEAAEFTGLTEAYIRRACKAKTLDALRDGGWKIRRASLLAL